MCSVLIVERKLKNSCKKGRKNVLQKMWKKITGWVKVLWSMRGKIRFSDSSAESEKQRIKKVAIWVENADIAYRHIYCNRSNCMGWISV